MTTPAADDGNDIADNIVRAGADVLERRAALISDNVVVLTKEEMDELTLKAFQEGVKRGRIEKRIGGPKIEDDASKDIVERLEAHCVGHPYASIPWPHHVLGSAIYTIKELRAKLAEAERAAAEAARAAAAEPMAGRFGGDQ